MLKTAEISNDDHRGAKISRRIEMKTIDNPHKALSIHMLIDVAPLCIVSLYLGGLSHALSRAWTRWLSERERAKGNMH